MSSLYKRILLCFPAIFALLGPVQAAESDCVPAGKVLLPAEKSWTVSTALARQLGDKKVVLLGEHHDNVEHHRWQLQMITSLHALNPEVVLGFEMFPRRVQPVLDRWVAGELTEEEFLKQVGWSEYWRFDPALYLPMFHYARMNGIPMYALNVERSLIRKVGAEGWEGVPLAEREGVSKPHPASQGYKEMLASVFMAHNKGHGESGKEEVARILADPGFNRFAESQSAWDRAMAEAIATARQTHRNAMVVAVIGSGHMMYRFGVPEQLRALGVAAPAVLIPWDSEFECNYITPEFADAVIGLRVERASEKDEAERPRLGIYLEKGEGGVLVTKILPGSLAETSGLKERDLIIEMAGRPVTEVEQVVESVKSMQAGTWLPLKVRRDGEGVAEVVAKFPNRQ